MHPVLINGEWTPSQATEGFQAVNPATREKLPGLFPVSPLSEVTNAIEAAARAFEQVAGWPGTRFAEFLERYAVEIENIADLLVTTAHQETALPVSPRLKEGELPRTTSQLRQAAAAARDESWRQVTIDTAAGIRSAFGSLGPIVVFGPNNFPFAFNSISGGDFAAAVAAGNPVIAKGHPAHPETTRLLAQAAQQAAQATGMPAGFVQLIYHTPPEGGALLVTHPEVGASGYTGGRAAGLLLKEAADRAGKPFYAELSSINPVFLLPQGLSERFDAIVTEFVTSALMGTGQFCTNPGLVFVPAGELGERFISAVADKFNTAPVGTLLNEGTAIHLRAGIVALQRAGATVVTGNQPADGSRFCHANTLLRASTAEFLAEPMALQTEAFGNAALIIPVDTPADYDSMIRQLEGSLTGTIYSSLTGGDDALYDQIEPLLRRRVGRLLNDRMPTGVAVSPAMNHGGPFPSTGHPGFTAVGIPASLHRFAALRCWDNVRLDRLPAVLRDRNAEQRPWRQVNGQWTRDDVQTS